MQTWPQTWLLGAFAWAPPGAAMRPLRAAQPAFEAALKRRLPGDDVNENGNATGSVFDRAVDPAAVAPQPPPQPVPLQPAAEAPRWTAQPIAEPHAALRQWQVQAEQGVEPAANRWQLRLLDATLPVQQIDVQRTPAGTLQVVVSTNNADALRPLHTERLRSRLAARGEAPVSVLDVQSDTRSAPSSSSSTEQELP
jgi:hypothetical protein